MLAANVPANFPIPFANSAGASYITTPVPTASQISVTPGRASLTDGFPPLNFLPVPAGGVPFWGADVNGLMYQITSNIQWYQAGGTPKYNAAFSTAIGGYPNGAILQNAAGTGIWLSTVDNNTSNPDTGGANWVAGFTSPLAVGAATLSTHAAQLEQLTGVIGSVRNLKASVTAGATTATFTADQVIVGSALNGIQASLPSFSGTLNLAGTVGTAGSMLTGTATANGFCGVYAIWGTAGMSVGGVMESGTALPTVCAVSLPAGYTESSLITVVPISSTAGQFASFSVQDRKISIPEFTYINSNTTSGTPGNSALTSTGIPNSARRMSGSISISNSAIQNSIWKFFADANSTGSRQYSVNSTTGGGGNLFGYESVPLSAAQTLRATAYVAGGSGTMSYILLTSAYEI